MKPLRTLLVLLALAAISLGARRAEAAVVVAATTPDLAAITRQIGGSAVEVSALALPTQDPHFVDARPNLALVLNKADLLVVQGADLEIGWLPVLQAGARNPKIQNGGSGYLDGAGCVQLLEVPAGQVSRAQGDIHPSGNPHYLEDPRNGAKVGRCIAQRLAQIDPAHAADFDRNAGQLEKDAGALAASLAARANAIDAGKRKVVVYHRSWIYLETWLGINEVGAVEPKPGIPPDPAHVAQLLVKMRAEGVKAILAESYYPQTTTKLLAEKTGAELISLSGGASDNESYLDHVRQMAEKTIAALSK